MANPWDPYVSQLNQKAQQAGVTAENYDDVFAHHSDGSNLESIFGDLSGQIDKRAASTDHRQVDSQSPEGDDLYGSGTGNASNRPGGLLVTKGGGGGSNTADQLSQLLQVIQGINAQPGVDLSGITPGDIPAFEVPGEDLGPAIDNTLLDGMAGVDSLNMQPRLVEMLNQIRGGGINSSRLQNRLEGAREALTGGETAAMSDMMARLADRGLVSLPGSPQGMETDATMRILEPLQRAYLGNVRQAYTDESQQADQHELDTIAAATGWSQGQAAQKLAAATTAQERQQMKAEIALSVLDKNMEWNQFLAEFGLKREQVAAEIQAGRIDAIAPYLQMFMLLIQQSRGGYV